MPLQTLPEPRIEVAIASARAVKGAAKRAGMMIGTLERRSRISHPTMMRRLNGSVPFTLPEIFRIAAALEIPASELLADIERIIERAA